MSRLLLRCDYKQSIGEKIMKKLIMLLILGTFVSCATMTEKIPGYTQDQISAKRAELKGKNRNEIISILGKPVVEGLCYGGDAVGVGTPMYRMVYLKKETARYVFAMDMNSKKTDLKCTMVDLRKNDDGSYSYSGFSAMAQTGCNKSYGAITKTRDRSKCEQIYKN